MIHCLVLRLGPRARALHFRHVAPTSVPGFDFVRGPPAARSTSMSIHDGGAQVDGQRLKQRLGVDGAPERTHTRSRHRARDRDEVGRREPRLAQERFVPPDLRGFPFAKDPSRPARHAPQDDDPVRGARNEIEVVTRRSILRAPAPSAFGSSARSQSAPWDPARPSAHRRGGAAPAPRGAWRARPVSFRLRSASWGCEGRIDRDRARPRQAPRAPAPCAHRSRPPESRAPRRRPRRRSFQRAAVPDTPSRAPRASSRWIRGPAARSRPRSVPEV